MTSSSNDKNSIRTAAYGTLEYVEYQQGGQRFAVVELPEDRTDDGNAQVVQAMQNQGGWSQMRPGLGITRPIESRCLFFRMAAR